MAENHRRWVGAWAAILIVGSAVVARPAVAQSEPETFEYLYIEPSSGDSTGGHTAICFHQRCYHFQQDKAQTIRLHADDAEDFDYQYRLLGNRTIHASRVEVSPATYASLRSQFESRRQIQDRQFDVLQSLSSDRELIAQLIDRPAAPSTRLPGTAYFFADEDEARRAAPHAMRSSILENLAAQIRHAYGTAIIEQRRSEVRNDIAHLTPAGADTPLAQPAAGRLSIMAAGFSTRYRELVSGWAALEVLRSAMPLRNDALHAPRDSAFVLSAPESEVVRAYQAEQLQSLVRLFASSRPDWGYPLLIGMARLAALEASLQSGSLVVLDDFPEDAAAISAALVREHRDTLEQIHAERGVDFAAARRDWAAAATANEAAYSVLETAANLFIDIDHALADGARMRVYKGQLVPAKSALRQDWPRPELSRDALEPAVAVATQREVDYRAALQAVYPYDVISNNCVTEIFRTLDAGSVVEAERRLAPSGAESWRQPFDFIPALSPRTIAARYRVVERSERPSYRRLTLQRMYAEENRLRVDVRESNVFTARSYERNPEDPIFLFFTDDVVLRRPLYGLANLTAGLGGAVAGLATWPVDGGALLRAGVNGAVFSLPEIAFVNIRKGSFAFAPRSWLNGGAARLH